MANPPTFGVILAGGRASRMGGGDKPLKRLGGTTILDRVIAVLRPQCVGLIVNANGDPSRFAETGLAVVADSVPDFAGPLAGVLAGLDWVAEHEPGIEWVVSVAGDSPFLPSDLVMRLHAARLEAAMPLAQAQSDGQPHPVNALWRVDLRDDLRRALVDEKVHKVQAWTARHGVARASWPVEPVDPFFNANTPEDLTRAAELIAAGKRV